MNLTLVTPAYAEDTATATQPPQGAPRAMGAGDSLMNFLPLFLILIVMYLFLIRPQQKKFQEHQQILKSLRRGDKVVTGGGIVGTIVRLDGEDMLLVEIADDVRVKIQRATISSVLARTEPVGGQMPEDRGQMSDDNVKRIVPNDNRK